VNDDEPGFLDLLLDGLNVGLGYLVATGVIAVRDHRSLVTAAHTTA
jgi:hypothetical protein